MLKLTLINLRLEISHTNFVVQCNTEPNNNTIANIHVYQDRIPFYKNNKKLNTCKETIVSCEFNWLHHADFRLKWKIFLFEKKQHAHTRKLL